MVMRNRFCKLVGRCATGLLLAAPAFAQDRAPPYDVTGFPDDRVWVPWVFVFLFAVLMAMISFKNPRRSHLD